MKTTCIRTADLLGAQLDYAAAKAQGLEACIIKNIFGITVCRVFDGPRFFGYSPSINWEQGGSIIEREVTAIMKRGECDYWAHAGDHLGEGQTRLIAAMRAYVASKLGELVYVPEVVTK